MVSSIEKIWENAPTEGWLYIFLSSIIALYLLYYFKNKLRILKLVLSLGGPPAAPISGNAGYAFDDNVLYKASHTLYENYGSIFRVWLTVSPCVVLLEPKDIQQVLGSSKHTEKLSFYKMFTNFFGKGLITLNVETWAAHRRILQPAFHRQFLEKFTETFSRCSNRLADKLAMLDDQEINITTFVNDSVFEILNETVLGVNLHMDENASKISRLFREGKLVVLHRFLQPWLLIDWIYNMTRAGKWEKQHGDKLANTCHQILMKNRESRNQNEDQNNRKSLLDFMIELSDKYPNFNDQDIVDECSTFMLAGQDSVGTATAMTLFLLATNPKWMDKCVEEIDEIFENRENAAATMNDLTAMKCLEMCIKESLRLYPSVPFLFRHLGEDVTIGKHVLPAGCDVMIIPYTTHRLSHHFPDPHTFNPERFSPENIGNRHPYSYLPFSAGPRNCIGHKYAILEMKSIISAVLRKCVLSGISGKDEIRPKFRMTLRAKGGLWLRIVPRRDNLAKKLDVN